MKASQKLDILEMISMHIMEAENLLLSLGMVSEQLELSDFYERNIKSEYEYICETQLPEVIKK